MKTTQALGKILGKPLKHSAGKIIITTKRRRVALIGQIEIIQEQGGLNLYGFVGNNGLNNWDILGLSPMEKVRQRRKALRDFANSEEHTHRNKDNRIPGNEPRQGTDGKHRDGLGNRWVEDPHTPHHGKNKGYRTYRGTGENAGSEAVYDPDGVVVDSGPYMGTYNRGTTLLGNDGQLDLTDLDDIAKHYTEDVKPHSINPNYKENISTIYNDRPVNNSDGSRGGSDSSGRGGGSPRRDRGGSRW